MSEGTSAQRELRLGVIGDPVAHSLSPAFHRAFLARAGRRGRYEAIRVAAGGAALALQDLRAEGFSGINVTTPLKEEAYAACDRVDVAAAQLRAANTIVFSTAGTFGFNTDGAGAVGAIEALAHRAGSSRAVDSPPLGILLLGAGPTARAAAFALVNARRRVAIWNRTASKARALAVASGADVWNGTPDAIDIVFSTLPPNPELDANVRVACARATYVIDANYGSRATLGTLLARDVHDGTAMLEASAAASFALWSADPDDATLCAMTGPLRDS